MPHRRRLPCPQFAFRSVIDWPSAWALVRRPALRRCASSYTKGRKGDRARLRQATLRRRRPRTSIRRCRPRFGRGSRPARRRRAERLARSSEVAFQRRVPRATVVVLDDAAEVSGRDLDDGCDAVAVRAFDDFCHVLPWLVAADPHARSPARRAVHFTPPGRGTGPCVPRPRGVSTRHTPRGNVGTRSRPTVPQRFRATQRKRLTRCFAETDERPTPGFTEPSLRTFPRRFPETLNWPFSDAPRRRS